MRVLYLSHNGMTEPLGQTQVLPYLSGLSAPDVAIDLYACEPAGTAAAAIDLVRRQLRATAIRYTPLVRRPSHRLIDKGRDLMTLVHAALNATRPPAGPLIIHARSQLPSAAGQLLRALTPSARFIFDLRGLLAQEYVDMGHWRRGDLRYLVTEAIERHVLLRADRIVVLTEAMRDELCRGPLRRRPDDVVVIPCCVDPERFRPDPAARAARRARLGLSDGQVLLCFSGSYGRYDLMGAARLLLMLRRRVDARFLLLSRSSPAPMEQVMARLGLSAALHVVAAPPQEVPAWLCAADLAVAFLRRCRSSIATSPTKVAEYLAVGLPTALSAGVADSDRLCAPGLHPVPPDDDAALSQLADRLLGLVADPAAREETAARCRETALRHFSLPDVGVRRYRALYEQLS
jgi:glycosyltransferase involved in cell wall biosynthesis